MSDYRDDYRENYERVIDGIPEADRARAWGTMIYACMGPRPAPGSTGCGWLHRVWLGVGVEGPPDLRARELVVPAPMFCGACPRCEGMLGHDRWNEDEAWEPRSFPTEVARFTVPDVAEARRLAGEGYGGANYEDPSGRTTKLQRPRPRPNRRERRKRR